MNNKKSFLSRMTRRKDSTPAEPEEGAYEIPPPSAIEPGASYSEHQSEVVESGYGPHIELELLASDEPPRSDSTSRVDTEESGHAPALESSPAPISDESPDAPKPPRALEMHQEYGLELEVLAEPESDESPDAPESPQEDDESASSMVERTVEAPAPDAEAIGDSAPAHEESLAAPVSDELPDESEPSHDSEPFEGYGADFEALAAPDSSESPDEAESFQEDEASSSVPVAADQPQEQPDEPSESSIANNGYFPLVRDVRGNWRPGKGFSRSELQEAGMSLAEAARLRIRIDKRRRNAHPMNVATLENAKNGG